MTLQPPTSRTIRSAKASSKANRQARNPLVLGTHKLGEKIYAVLLDTSSPDRPRIVETHTFTPGDAQARERLFARAATIAQVLDIDATIVRSAATVQAPTGSPREVASALALVAEAQLGSTLAPHRRSAGIIKIKGQSLAVAAGWSKPASKLIDEQVLGVPIICALAKLIDITAASSALVVDHASLTACALGLTADSRLVCRDAAIASVDQQHLTEFLSEIDLTFADLAEHRTGELTLAIDPRTDVPGLGSGDSGRANLAQFGLALGAALSAIDKSIDFVPLVSMQAQPPIESRPLPARIFARLGSPKAAIAMLCVALAIILGAYLASVELMHRILKSQVDASGAQSTDAVAVLTKQEIAKINRERRLPITATLAEISAVAPTGVQIEDLSIDTNRSMNINATAPDIATANTWRAALVKLKLLQDVNMPRSDEGLVPVRFQITAKLADPLAIAATKGLTLTPRGSASVAPTNGATTPSSPERGTRATGNSQTPRRNTTASAATSPTPPTAPGAQTPVGPPPPISQTQIDALDLPTARLEFGRRSPAARNPSFDQATRDRLREEAEKIRDRLSQLNRSTSGGSQ